jgi:molybdopterin/thiamine biosynthesis adenylyltransferase
MLRPAIKRAHRPLALPGGRILLGLMQYGVASEISDDEQGGIERLVGLMDGTRDVARIATDLRSTHPDWDEADVRDVIEQLAESGHVEDLGAPLPPGLTRFDAERYRASRDFFSWIDTTPRSSPNDIQARIRHADVVLLGLGGTGSSVAASLVASGIGALHCVDFDLVEESNLTRQLIYTEADVGQPKVACAISRLRALNSSVSITGQELKVESAADIEKLIAGHDLFVLCADEPAESIQRWANRAALRTSTPWFMALYTGPMTVVGSFIPGETGCWECVDGRERQREVRLAGRWLIGDRPNAVVAGSAAVSGHLCALEVLYHIGGLPSQVRGKIFHHNVARWDHQYFIDADPDPNCPACGAEQS